MIRLLCFTLTLALAVAGARADQYWITYEGNDFPENVGWTRITFNGEAIRFLDQGNLVIDSRASIMIADFYHMDLAGTLDPDPGEMFIAQWRLLVEESTTLGDPTFEIRSDDDLAVLFTIDEDTLYSVFEPLVRVRFTPGAFHEFELRSSDMRAYGLYIDGNLALDGSFWPSVAGSFVSWGDGVQGAASLARWDYFRFGVVPEPNSALLFSLAFMIRRDRR